MCAKCQIIIMNMCTKCQITIMTDAVLTCWVISRFLSTRLFSSFFPKLMGFRTLRMQVLPDSNAGSSPYITLILQALRLHPFPTCDSVTMMRPKNLFPQLPGSARPLEKSIGVISISWPTVQDRRHR